MSNYDPKKSLTGFGLDILLLSGIFFFSCIVPWPSLAHYLLFPETPVFPTTLLPPQLATDPIVYVGYAVIVSYYACLAWQLMFIAWLLLCVIYICKSHFRIGVTILVTNLVKISSQIVSICVANHMQILTLFIIYYAHTYM